MTINEVSASYDEKYSIQTVFEKGKTTKIINSRSSID